MSGKIDRHILSDAISWRLNQIIDGQSDTRLPYEFNHDAVPVMDEIILLCEILRKIAQGNTTLTLTKGPRK